MSVSKAVLSVISAYVPLKHKATLIFMKLNHSVHHSIYKFISPFIILHLRLMKSTESGDY